MPFFPFLPSSATAAAPIPPAQRAQPVQPAMQRPVFEPPEEKNSILAPAFHALAQFGSGILANADKGAWGAFGAGMDAAGQGFRDLRAEQRARNQEARDRAFQEYVQQMDIYNQDRRFGILADENRRAEELHPFAVRKAQAEANTAGIVKGTEGDTFYRASEDGLTPLATVPYDPNNPRYKSGRGSGDVLTTTQEHMDQFLMDLAERLGATRQEVNADGEPVTTIDPDFLNLVSPAQLDAAKEAFSRTLQTTEDYAAAVRAGLEASGLLGYQFTPFEDRFDFGTGARDIEASLAPRPVPPPEQRKHGEFYIVNGRLLRWYADPVTGESGWIPVR